MPKEIEAETWNGTKKKKKKKKKCLGTTRSSQELRRNQVTTGTSPPTPTKGKGWKTSSFCYGQRKKRFDWGHGFSREKLLRGGRCSDQELGYYGIKV